MPKITAELADLRAEIGPELALMDAMFPNIRHKFEELFMKGPTTREIEMHSLMKMFLEMGERLQASYKKLLRITDELERYHRPARNQDRNAKIMKLRSEGKSAGQIRKLLAPKWKMTDAAIRSVWGKKKK